MGERITGEKPIPKDPHCADPAAEPPGPPVGSVAPFRGPPQWGSVAQWLERVTADQQVPGSNPGVCSFGNGICVMLGATCLPSCLIYLLHALEHTLPFCGLKERRSQCNLMFRVVTTNVG